MWPTQEQGTPSPKQFLFFLAVLLIFPLAIPVLHGQGHGTLGGIVTDQFNAVISGALVGLYSTDRVLQAKSDKNGRFEFAEAPSGTYELEASSAGFQPRKIEGIRIPEKDAEVISIRLLIANQPSDCGKGPSATYEAALGQPALIGSVRQYAAGPLAGFKIGLSKAGGTRVLASRRSNEKGEFQFRDVEPGQYVLRASHKGNWTAQSDSFWITRENITRISLDASKRGTVILCQ
jgi:carboxypeptidase family protein